MDKQVVKLSSGTRNNNPRKIRNASLAESYEKQGYEVVRRGYPNNAFVAIYKGSNPHNQLERTVGEIFAENGLSFTLEKDGGVKIRLRDGRSLEMPSLDGWPTIRLLTKLWLFKASQVPTKSQRVLSIALKCGSRIKSKGYKQTLLSRLHPKAQNTIGRTLTQA